MLYRGYVEFIYFIVYLLVKVQNNKNMYGTVMVVNVTMLPYSCICMPCKRFILC